MPKSSSRDKRLADLKDRAFELGPTLKVHSKVKQDFTDLEKFKKSALATTLGPFLSQSSLAVALTRNPLVLVRVVDSDTNPVPNVRLELSDDNDTFVDAVPSDSIGLGLLRFASQEPAIPQPDIKGNLRVAGGDPQPVVVPSGQDFVVVHVRLETAAPSAADARHDSVIPRLPAFFSIKAADEIIRHRVTADGPDPCFASAVDRQCTYRAPRVRWIYARRTVYARFKPPRRLYVRVRQEWHYVGHSFGQPERIDSRDVASLVGSLDANLQAALAAVGTLDVSTESVLSAEASGKLRAQASLDGELDASVGLHLFEGGIGNPLSVSGDADVSIDTSLLVSAQLKLRASLRNQLHARAALSGRASVGLEADASVSVNPSLSRELNMPRFIIHENYAVMSFVEDVQEIQEFQLFEDLSDKTVIKPKPLPFWPFPFPSPPLFPPADIVEYRPIFERKLLEPALAGRFRALRQALESAAGRGPLVRRLRFDVTYSATAAGRFSVQVLGRSASVKLRPSASQARVVVDLPGGQFLDVLNGEVVDFHVSLAPEAILSGGGTVKITGIQGFSDASPIPHSYQVSGLEAKPGTLVDSQEGVQLVLRTPDAGLLNDPLVVHVNRNPTYYMGLLVKAALANPSLRFDVPQLRDIGPDSLIWKMPIHGFAGNKALVVVPAVDVPKELLQDVGRATMVQLAVDGNWTEAMQAKNALADALGQIFPALQNLQLPTELLEGLLSGAGLIPSIVDATATAAALGGTAGAVPSAAGGVLGTVAGVLDL